MIAELTYSKPELSSIQVAIKKPIFASKNYEHIRNRVKTKDQVTGWTGLQKAKEVLDEIPEGVDLIEHLFANLNRKEKMMKLRDGLYVLEHISSESWESCLGIKTATKPAEVSGPGLGKGPKQQEEEEGKSS
ncbi:hypothetical protein GCK72_025704 [Caenorhabditis remanei]|uniref:Uncharacterized protein n=1 Tax=Caenorhabditis remanei TaxID=31234 RepID=A0A6A5G2N7_CAERE|nr:hypothetical protein GCK72_025704 [Caenorhabditis remanei]KAF1749237.1 hypothetical protein GCK72_025704 [Caenorhabditis remanei]